MYEILVAIDDDVDGAHAQVDAIESMVDVADDVVVHLLHVFTDNPSGASIMQVESAREASERLEALGVEVRAEEASGDPATQILQRAEAEGVDRISVGGRKRSPTGKALFGSVTQSVILGTELPVLVCGRRSES